MIGSLGKVDLDELTIWLDKSSRLDVEGECQEEGEGNCVYLSTRTC